MQKIPIQRAAPDMVLAKPATRENGMVLVAAGTTLTAQLLSRLENMGVEQLVVEGAPLDAGGSDGRELAAQKLERLDYLFRNFKDDKYMQKVKNAVGEYFIAKAAMIAARTAPPASSTGGE